MSWMDSWSRPGKSQAIPPPLYLTPGGENTLYCHTCGRVISSRKTTSTSQPVKYCSERCRSHKPGPLDRRIEATFVALLNGADPSTLSQQQQQQQQQQKPDQPTAPPKPPIPHRRKKGEPRLTISCLTVETLVFGARVTDPSKHFGRKKNRATRALGPDGEDEEWKSVDMVDRPGPMLDNPHSRSSNAPEAQGGDYSAGESSASETDGGVGYASETGSAAGSVGSAASGSGGGGGGVRVAGAGKVRPPQKEDEVNFSVGGERGWAEKIEETEEMRAKRLEGARKAEEREMVRRAARRLCAFGVAVEGEEGEGEAERDGGKEGARKGRGKGGKKGRGVDEEEGRDGEGQGKRKERRKKCEAIVNEKAVEASFAKGEWGIRWRE